MRDRTLPTRYSALEPCFGAGRLAITGMLTLLVACGGDAAVGPGAAAPDGTTKGQAGSATTGTNGGVNPFAGASFWIDPSSNARRTADAWRTVRPVDAGQLEKIASQPQVSWFGDWNTDVARDADAATATISAAGALPVFVAYNMPKRDCGGLSGDNTTGVAAYRGWIAALADGIGSRRAVVILEPDALAGMDCLGPADQQMRLDLIAYAVQTLRARGSVAVYLDAGNPGWQTAATMADRLTRAGIAAAQGFALNVSNFLPTASNLTYGRAISALIGNKHFVIDTGRNGTGANGDWCNPAGRALGERPSSGTGQALVDAFLWVKAPGESDGVCHGATASGDWMPEYALGLAQRAAY
jgi:endoglucanase